MGRYSYSQPSNSSNTSVSSKPKPTPTPTPTRRSGSSYGFPKKYLCRLDTIIQTSTTAQNPGRRFYGCRNYDDGGYHIMKFWDEAMMEEFMDVKLTVDQICENIDFIYLSYAENGALTALHDEIQKMQRDLAQLQAAMKEKPSGGIEVKNRMLDGAVLIVLIISVCVGFNRY